MKRYESYKDSGVEWIGEIPKHWDVGKMGYLLSNNDGGVWGEDDTNQSGTYVIRSTEITIEGEWDLSNPMKRLLSETEKVKYKLWKNDIVITKSSGSSDHIGKSVIVDDKVEALHCCYSNFVQRIRFNTKCLPSLYHKILNSYLVREQYKYLTQTTTGLGNLNSTTLNNVILPFIPLSEQYQIVTYLDNKTAQIDDLIKKKERKIELLKEYRTALINKVVTKGLDPDVEMKDSGVEWIGEIPKHWEVIRLKYLTSIVYGISPPDTTYNDNGVGSILVNGPVEYSQEDFGYTRSLKWTTDPKKFCQKGSLLFCLRGSTTGRLNIAHTDISIGRGVCSIRSKESQSYLTYSMILLRIWIQEQLSGSTFPSVTSDDVNNYFICSPPIKEQENIVLYLDEQTQKIDNSISIEERKIELLKEYRQSLISNVVTGKIKVTTDD
jgi:type I restriction enzyme S subunit